MEDLKNTKSRANVATRLTAALRVRWLGAQPSPYPKELRNQFAERRSSHSRG